MTHRSTAASIGLFLTDAFLGSVLFIAILMLSGACIGGGAHAEAGSTPPLTFIMTSPGEPLVTEASGILHDRAARPAPLELQKPRLAGMPHPDNRALIWVLGIVFSSLVALNLGFVRHLRRTYARSR